MKFTSVSIFHILLIFCFIVLIKEKLKKEEEAPLVRLLWFFIYLLNKNKNKSRCKEKEPDGEWGVGTDKILTAPVRADHVRTQSTCIRISLSLSSEFNSHFHLSAFLHIVTPRETTNNVHVRVRVLRSLFIMISGGSLLNAMLSFMALSIACQVVYFLFFFAFLLSQSIYLPKHSSIVN